MTFLILLLASVLQTTAQTLNDRYNRQRPVVIVIDNSNISSFDDKGLPPGCYETLIKAVTDESNLPCRIFMKGKDEARQDFERGEADILITDPRNYQNPNCVVSKNAIVYMQLGDGSTAEARPIGKDRQLIESLDDTFARLKESGYISMIKDRWIHPERAIPEPKPVPLYIAIILFVLAAVRSVLRRLAAEGGLPAEPGRRSAPVAVAAAPAAPAEPGEGARDDVVIMGQVQ